MDNDGVKLYLSKRTWLSYRKTQSFSLPLVVESSVRVHDGRADCSREAAQSCSRVVVVEVAGNSPAMSMMAC